MGPAPGNFKHDYGKEGEDVLEVDVDNDDHSTDASQ